MSTSKRNEPSPSMNGMEESFTESWVAIEPLAVIHEDAPELSSHLNPPSFESAQFDIILRRQRQRSKDGSGLKSTTVPSRFHNLPNTFEFSGWGTMSRIQLDKESLARGEQDVQEARRAATLGQFTASAVAGNAVLGSVFYALPAVVMVSGVFSPISLLAATSMLFLWRPIMEELASALPISGAPYTYLLNVSSKGFALVGAALLLLDFASTSAVSAATAISYLEGEVTLPFPNLVGTLLVLVVFMVISLGGLRDSARLALTVLSIHVLTMLILFLASVVAWSRVGNGQLKENWHAGQGDRTLSGVARQIFNGICVGVLGLTGFECVPSYVSSIKPGRFPAVLRNLHYPAMIMNILSMLFVLALIPLKTILQGSNVLSILAEVSAGRWLRIFVVVDAVIVLCGGVLTGILGACELFERLSRDRLLPQFFLKTLRVTKAPALTIISFTTFTFVIYVSSGANLVVISKMFSLVWLTVMTLFPLSALLLRFNRGRLARESHPPLFVVGLTFVLAMTIIGGNVAIDPSIMGYAAAYFIVIVVFFHGTMKKARILQWIFWAYDQSPALHNLAFTKQWGKKMSWLVGRMRRKPLCVLIKTDEINHLFHELLYIRQNEETSSLKLVHFYDEEFGIPSEMEANWKILDEAFPEITVDLILVKASFTPTNLAALAHQLGIPRSLMFMACPGPHFPYGVAEFGTRLISL